MPRIFAAALTGALLSLAPLAQAQSCPGTTVDDNNPDMAASARAFVQRLQTLVETNDRQQVALLVSYPLRVNRGPRQRMVIRSRADLLAHFDAIVTPRVKAALAGKDAVRCLFYNSNGFMIGSGQIWFSGNSAGTLRIISVNP